MFGIAPHDETTSRRKSTTQRCDDAGGCATGAEAAPYRQLPKKAIDLGGQIHMYGSTQIVQRVCAVVVLCYRRRQHIAT